MHSRSLIIIDSADAGFEFRSAATRTYLVEFKDARDPDCAVPPSPYRYAGNVRADARGLPDIKPGGYLMPLRSIEQYGEGEPIELAPEPSWGRVAYQPR